MLLWSPSSINVRCDECSVLLSEGQALLLLTLKTPERKSCRQRSPNPVHGNSRAPVPPWPQCSCCLWSEQRIPSAATNNHHHDCSHTSPLKSLALLLCFAIWYIKNSTDSKCMRLGRPRWGPKQQALPPWVHGTTLEGMQSECWGVCGACSSEWEK